MCYNCTAEAPYKDSNEKCMKSDAYKKENCTGAPECAEMKIMVNNKPIAYSAGCVVSTK